MEMAQKIIEAKDIRTFVRVYYLFQSEQLSANINLILHKDIIRSIMTYACPALQFAAGNHLLKFQLLQKKVLRTIENYLRSTPVRDLHMSFKLPYLHDYVSTKLCRQQAEFHTKS
jgi:hypothetical protein